MASETRGTDDLPGAITQPARFAPPHIFNVRLIQAGADARNTAARSDNALHRGGTAQRRPLVERNCVRVHMIHDFVGREYDDSVQELLVPAKPS